MTCSEFLSQFRTPDPRYSPAPIWWWSGEKLEIGRLRWQMDQLLGMGIHNVVILNLAPSGPLYGCDADDPPFLSEEWWSIFTQVCDHARSIGMYIWFYDQIGFSGANYQAELVARHPEFSAEQIARVKVEGTGALRAVCPGGARPMTAFVAPLERPDDARYIALDGRSASIDVSEPSRLSLVYAVRQGYDYFNRAACEKLLDAVHREFARRLPQHIGATIVGSFQDELPDLPAWSRDFAKTFRVKFGYDIQDVIHRLFESGDMQSRITRMHYHQHRANLAEETLFKPFFDWHEEHKLQCGFDQQSPAREARAIGCVQKYADYVQTHRWYAIPGCDLHGNGKLHSSIAWMYERPRVWLEGFHSTGWGGTIADTFDWLLPFLQSGATLYNPHAVYYSTRKGWWEWAPPSTCWRQPYAQHYRGFAEMIARITSLLSQGVQQADVAVLFPTATVQASLGIEGAFKDAQAADLALHETLGSMRWHQAKLGALDRAAIGFHVVDEQTLCAASLDRSGGEGECVLSHRGVAFDTVILPGVTMLDRETAERLIEFSNYGGQIVSIGASTIASDDGSSLDLSKLPNTRVVQSADDLDSSLVHHRNQPRCSLPLLHRKIHNLNVALIPAIAGMATNVRYTDWFASLDEATADAGKYAKSVEMKLPADAKSAFRFDAITGDSRPMAVGADGALRVDFEGSPFAIIAWSGETMNESAHTPAAASREITLPDRWQSEYEWTLPDAHADIYDPARPWQRQPHTAEFRWMRGEGSASWREGLPGEAETVRATFGERAKAITPAGERPVVYSPQFGIAQDTVHLGQLGPKGHVPEEFINFPAEENDRFVIQTGVVSDQARRAVLAIGSNGRKSCVFAGRKLEPADARYLWMTPIDLAAGENPIEIHLAAEKKGQLRAFWCLVDPEAQELFRRPERMANAGEHVAGSTITYRRSFDLDSDLREGKVQVAVAAVAQVFVDDQLLFRLGGFDPYSLTFRGSSADLPTLSAGRHELRIEVLDAGRVTPVLVDLLATDHDGRRFALMVDEQWSVERDGGQRSPITFNPTHVYDPAAWRLYRRPHALPGVAWLDAQQPGVVLDLPLIPPLKSVQTQWLGWMIPPGAVSMTLQLVDCEGAEIGVDGEARALNQDGTVDLSGSRRCARSAVLCVRCRQAGGGMLAAPVTYVLGPGELATGSWVEQGLRSYSGAVRMRQSIRIDRPSRAILDLGKVRGTVAAYLNGELVGVRFMPPYRFDFGVELPACDHEIELLVTNTLANFLSTWSPTRGWSTDQFESGVLGPVILRMSN